MIGHTVARLDSNLQNAFPQQQCRNKTGCAHRDRQKRRRPRSRKKRRQLAAYWLTSENAMSSSFESVVRFCLSAAAAN